MSAPRYQEVTAATIPTYEKDGVRIRVVAGTVEKVTGPVTDIAASPLYMDVELAPGIEWDFDTPAGHTLITYVFEGEGVFSGETVNAVKMLQYSDGDCITVKTENNPVRFMLISGAPFKKPIVPYRPFVMNTIEEIQQTFLCRPCSVTSCSMSLTERWSGVGSGLRGMRTTVIYTFAAGGPGHE